MTALPVPLPLPMTAAAYAALPEEQGNRFELQEGAVVMSPRPIITHQMCISRLILQLTPQLPAHLMVVSEVDVDMKLAAVDGPGTVRVPDLVVIEHEAAELVSDEGRLLTAGEVVIAVEIHSPSTYRTDTMIKHDEYADAGIGHYWMIDLADGPSLVACHLAGEFGYADAPPATGTFTTEQPFPVRIDLAALGG